jgi:hypothetical protein
MIWLTWRQFRVPALVTVAALAVIAIVLGFTGVHLHDLYGTYKSQVRTCHARNLDCDTLANTFLHHYHHLYQWLGTIVVAVPGIIGIFWGPPLIARELETGGFRLAWTQSITRTRWLATKLGLVGAAAILTAGLLSLMVTWWAVPIDHLSTNRFSAEIFSERGLVPIGYAAFAFVLGVTLGFLIRRTLPAMAVTLVAFVAIRQAVIAWVRPHLIAASHASLPLRNANSFGFTSNPSGGTTFFASGANLPNTLTVSSRLVDANGKPPSAAAMQSFLQTECPKIATASTSRAAGAPTSTTAFSSCIGKLSAHFHDAVAYIPADHYWDLQLAETVVYLAAAVILAAVCFWWIRHRLA